MQTSFFLLLSAPLRRVYLMPSATPSLSYVSSPFAPMSSPFSPLICTLCFTSLLFQTIYFAPSPSRHLPYLRSPLFLFILTFVSPPPSIFFRPLHSPLLSFTQLLFTSLSSPPVPPFSPLPLHFHFHTFSPLIFFLLSYLASSFHPSTYFPLSFSPPPVPQYSLVSLFSTSISLIFYPLSSSTFSLDPPVY